MSGRYLLDTNIAIALFADESAVKDHLREAEEVFVPSIVLGVVLWGGQVEARGREHGAHR